MDKILVEAPLAGRFTLGANEIYQYGFKLAARSSNTNIFPIDTFGPSIYDDASAAGKRIDGYLKTHFKSVKDPGTDASERRDRSIESNASWYSVFAGMGRKADSAGATYVAQWSTRNCFIFSNILSVVRPGDRVVLFLGQIHEYLLREFVRLNPDLIDVSPMPYLK